MGENCPKIGEKMGFLVMDFTSAPDLKAQKKGAALTYFPKITKPNFFENYDFYEIRIFLKPIFLENGNFLKPEKSS